MPITNKPLVSLSGNRLITTSLAISQHFERKHKHILEAIQNLECSPEFAEPNFRPCSYSDGNQRQRPMYEITRDGFMFLCMGFTGAQAAKWKEAYIQAFNQLEQQAQETDPVQQIPAYMRQLLLECNPQWERIKRYKQAGLNLVEVGKLMECSKDHVRKQVRKMEKCGILQPPKNLAQMQQQALPMLAVRHGGAQ